LAIVGIPADRIHGRVQAVSASKLASDTIITIALLYLGLLPQKSFDLA